MAKVNAPLLALNRGEISKHALARIDLAKMALAAECQLNWAPTVLGPMILRPGMAYVGGVYNDLACQIVDFAFSRSDTALIELTDLRMRVWIDDVLLARPSVSTTVGDPNMTGSGSWSSTGTTDGCSVTVAAGIAYLQASARGGLARMKQTLTIAPADQNVEHGLKIHVDNGPVTLRAGTADGLADVIGETAIDTGWHSIAFTPATASVYLRFESTDRRKKGITQVTIDSAGTLSIITPWTAAELSSVRWSQSGDVLYLAVYGGQQYKIERRGARPGARGWSCVAYRPENGPFSDGPSSNAFLTPSVHEGNGTLSSSQAYFTSDHVGALFRLFSPRQPNQALLGAANAFSESARITGVNNDRKFNWVVTGTWVGTLTLQRSLVGPDSGFVDVVQQTANGTYAVNDTNDAATAGQASLNNVIAWYRVGFKGGDYTSGSATVVFSGTGASSGGRYGICRVTAYTSTTQVDMEVLDAFSSLDGATLWQEGAWSDFMGWPASVVLQEGRLWWLGGGLFQMAGSEPNDYTGFATNDRNGDTLGDAGAILENFGEGPSDRVNWGLGLSRLLCGREGSIASIRSSSFDTPLTPTDFAAKDCSQQGAARLPAIKVGKRGIFVQANGSRIYELYYNAPSFDYEDKDLTRFNHEVALPEIVDLARATQPDVNVFFVRQDGLVAVLLYDINDEVEAWWRIQTLGVVENVRVLPPLNGVDGRVSGPDDRVYFVVKRVVNGATKRFIERLSARSENLGAVKHLGLDSHVVYEGVAAASVTAAHLPNTTVSIWADGEFIGSATTNGSGVVSPLPDGQSHETIVAGITGRTVTYSGVAATSVAVTGLDGIPGEFFCDQQPDGRMIRLGPLVPAAGAVELVNGISASNVVGYFGYMAPFMSAKLGYGAQGGTALNQKKKIGAVGLVLTDTHHSGLQTGQRFDKLDSLPAIIAGAEVAANTVWSEYDQPVTAIGGGWDTDARLCLLGQAPYPARVGAVIVDMKTNG